MTPAQAEIGIFGGSGIYEFLEHAVEVDVETPYGGPSATAMVGRVEDRSIAFLPRHGRDHELPPHRINYAANAWAMKELGVSGVIGPCAAGSLKAELQPGHFAVCDQLVDRTTEGRTRYTTDPRSDTSRSPTLSVASFGRSR